MTILFSKTTGGFYDTSIHGDHIPSDAVEIPAEYHESLLAGQSAGMRIEANESGCPVLADSPAPTPAEIQAALSSEIQMMLDNKARERGYDSMLSACSYATSTIQKFAAEAQTCVAWRDAVWAKCYEILDEVNRGVRPVPTFDDLVAEFPEFEWPV